ncbi:hypothetical protein BDW22DRAFT_272046 [Trametopsis cervina]|nr:hypothetical protein BDW22DRAFT_272046 [Trametopsis cervina]
MPATTSVKPDSSRRTSNPIFPSRSSSSTSLTIAQTPLAQDGASTDSDPQVASGSKARPRATGKTSGACVHCKSLKVRCQFTTGHAKCDRCEAGNHECVPRSRKKRKVAPTQDDLQMRSYQQDEQIRTLLRQFDQLRMDAKISDWIRRAETTVRSGWSSARSARPLTSHYYSALIGPLNIDLSPSNPDFKRLPMLLRTGILEPYEVLDLFNLHFERVNSFFALLDGELHSPQKLVWTSHFLFTAICACASRHYLRRPGLHDVLMDIGRDAAAEALVSGKKSVETVQAFLLLAVYPLPEKKWTNNRSWLLTGAAIRLAQELELDKTLHELSQRENLNRTRTWIMCFCVDKSHAAECGKMHMIRPNGRLMQGELRSWYKTNPSINTPYDIALCGYTEMFLLLANFRHEIGFCDVLKQKCAEGYDVLTEAITYDKRLAELSAWWSLVLVEDPNYLICPIVHYRTHSFSMVSSYLRLVVLSVGFQHAVKQGITRESYILQQVSSISHCIERRLHSSESITVAQAAIKTVIEWLFPSGFLGWAMEVCSTKLLSPLLLTITASG